MLILFPSKFEALLEAKCQELKSGFAVTKSMKNSLVNLFVVRGFTKGGAILTKNFYIPKTLIRQPVPVKEE